MRKNQYSESIVIGLLAGAVVALIVGNSTTAILAGVITAGIAAWVGSLQWGKAREFAVSVADRIDVKEMTSAIANFLSSIKRLITSLAVDVNARKRVGAVMVLIIFLVENIFLSHYLLDLAAHRSAHRFLLDYEILRVIVALLLVWLSMVSLFLAVLSIFIAIALLFNELSVKNKGTFLFNWYR